MSFNILRSLQFEKELKRLVKKYPSLKKEYKDLISSLENKPTQGTPIGQNCYKIRIPIASKGKGKSGGARVITCVFLIEEVVYLVSIYDKSEKENISDKELQSFIKSIQ
ncbi:type II toxin-antitoxin system RelE/ParE family toxin [Leptospira interrogans]|uniref:type II toxin-antitoxin system RelE/ParE family toxin n=1 Tax=Leptospira interrogans TaxID=173 RepID=UPI001F114BCF|nr:type II toxin-antitoxin system RelE/ParE family toxin [Leptospira interrogans]UMQ53418.1 type II toxin-antitoxin system RelE/ParE family toxin [Leptospira interrogans]UMQ53995.1 type II toxin-antitoxin system RelE/ParE family toxin [Leptospira interrogans]UMQ54377.1 type II toxin-antitoxin system RelE/ParE family toxin [Leptospira interrogans]UMQ54389.1 type II toxin-antitoxin system RelE/ParE family toxin [Leptospira interrogans]